MQGTANQADLVGNENLKVAFMHSLPAVVSAIGFVHVQVQEAQEQVHGCKAAILSQQNCCWLSVRSAGVSSNLQPCHACAYSQEQSQSMGEAQA